MFRNGGKTSSLSACPTVRLLVQEKNVGEKSCPEVEEDMSIIKPSPLSRAALGIEGTLLLTEVSLRAVGHFRNQSASEHHPAGTVLAKAHIL